MNKLLITSFLLAGYASLLGIPDTVPFFNYTTKGKEGCYDTIIVDEKDDINVTNINVIAMESITLTTKKTCKVVNICIKTLTMDITAQSIEIKKCNFSGDLLVTFPENGSCILDGVTIKGNLKIRGAGNKITIKGTSKIGGDILFLEGPGKVDASSDFTLGGSITNGEMTGEPGPKSFISKKMLFGTILSIGVLVYFWLKKNKAKKIDEKETVL